MFQSSILDVVVGSISIFLAVSLATSAITEAIASALKLRQKNLLEGVKALLKDPKLSGLAGQLYSHALVNPLVSNVDSAVRSGKPKVLPAYIESRNFGLALTDLLGGSDGKTPAIDAIAKIENEELRQTLTLLWNRADGNLAAFQSHLGQWFDDAMDRLGGWYKRKTQAISFFVALAVAIAINADLVRAISVLWDRPALKAVLDAGAAAPNDATLQKLIQGLDRAHLIGWGGVVFDAPHGLLMFTGWVFVAAASLFGAPFWFDVLARFTSIRGTGAPAAKPEEKK